MTRIRTLVVAVLLAGSTFSIVRGSMTDVLTALWTGAGPFTDARTGAAAVSLSDGRTIITGGNAVDGTPTDVVVIYDPAAASFTTVGQLVSARTGHTATLLSDGSVVVAGGTTNGVINADLELFDVTSGTSSVVATMGQPRTGHAAARLADGTVLIVGGSTTDGVILQSAEVVDPVNGSVTQPAYSLSQRRTGASATTLLDGRVLVAGGSDGTADLGTAEIYYPLSQTFVPVDTQFSVPRAGHVALLLPHNNGVLIAGGSSAGQAVTTSDLFLPAIFPDPFSYGVGQFTATGAMAAARTRAIGGPAAGKGLAFVAGGGAADAEHYHFATIKTDKDDYAPGERAVITGTGWQPGEEVTLLFQEDPAVHDDYVLTVTADGQGNIYWDQWAPEEHDLNVRFYLTARDSQSRAQTTFTDARIINKVELTYSGTTITCHVPGACTGNLVVPPNATISAKIFVTTTQTGGNNWGSTDWRVATTAPGTATCVNHSDLSGDNVQHNQTFDISAPGTSDTYNAYFRASNNNSCGGNISELFTFPNSITVSTNATLKVKKAVVNDNGGTAIAGDWTLAVNSPDGGTGTGSAAGSTTGTDYTLQAGKTYNVTETGGPLGYTESKSANCTNLVPVAGGTYECTITNDDQPATLTVIKHVINDNGGTKAASDISITVTGANVQPSATFAGAESPGTTVTLDAGSYSVDEAAVSGYTKTLGANCSGTISNGETKTCTVTNDDQPGTLYVIKHVINNNGGTKVASDFSMTVTATNVQPGATFAGAEAPGTSVTLNAGSYSVDEGAVSGYAKSLSAECSGVIGNGETKTCTITNDDIQPKLIVIKHVINDHGGTAISSVFTMSVTGTNAMPASFAGAESPGTTVALDAGAYTVGETGPTGYAQSSSIDCSGSIAIGETKTCTITNDDIQPKLKVIKTVINDNGGTLVAANFTMTVTGTDVSSPSFPGAAGPGGTEVGLDAGGYSVDETAVFGYAKSASADCTGMIAIGQTKTCTITNDDIQPKLYVIKHVVNNNGGVSTASSFTMSVTGSNVSPASFPGAESPGTLVTLNAGSYSVGETPQPLYVRSDSGDCSGTIGLGEVKTCTITNNDLYDFRGFFNPVENLPTVNKVNAGRAIPLKWELRDHLGNYVLDLDTVESIQYLRVACSAGEVVTAMPLDADDSGVSGLRITDNQYHFNWKTEKGFANWCMELRVTLDDATVHVAKFQFTK